MTLGSEKITYTLDLAAPLVQVLVANEDGIRTAYLYGVARIGEEDSAWQYYLADHLGSVRSLVDAEESVAGTRAYQPYGAPLSSAGVAESVYGFTGEQTDPTGLVYLRARMYAPGLELFLSRDPWGVYDLRPGFANGFNFGNANPVRYLDRTGFRAESSCNNWWGPAKWIWCDRIEAGKGKKENLGLIKNLYYWIGDVGRIWKGWRVAEDLLDHHLEGHRQGISISHEWQWLLRDSPEDRTKRDELSELFRKEYLEPALSDCQNEVEAVIEPKRPAGCENEECDTSLVRPKTSTDVGVALGKHRMNGWFRARVLFSGGDNYVAFVKVTYWIDDKHDFDENKGLGIHQGGVGFVPHIWMKWLENGGEAREFDVHLQWDETRILTGTQ
jgi:RHS repeat-associated protein